MPPPPAAAASGVHAAPLTYRSWQPGIVQLRPLSFGDFLTVPFRGFRFARATTLGGPLVMTLVSTAVGVLAGWLFLTDSQLGLLEPYPPMAGVEPLTIAVFVASIALWFASDMLASAMVMVGVSRAVIGEKVSFGEAWGHVVRRLGALTVLYLATLGIGLLSVSPGLVVFVVGVASDQPWLGVLGLLVMLGVALPVGVVVAVYLPAARGAIVMERVGVATAVRRTRTLMKGRFWWTLLILVVCGLIVGAVSQVVTSVGQVAAFVGLAIAPENPLLFAILFAVFYGLALIASNVATYSFLGSVYALVYLDARMRREGFDVDLAAYAEARHAATAGAG